VSLLLCFDFLRTSERLVTFDGLTHMSNIAQFHSALKDGDLPVRWLDKSANYGMPFGIFSQQLVAYIGALMMFVFQDTLMVFNLVIFIFAFLGCVSLYVFVKEYTDEISALGATILFSLAPYRIVNIYIRGAIPEFAASMFLPLILLCLKRWIVDKKINYLFLLVVSLTFLFLTHPISGIAFSIIAGIYFLFLIWDKKKRIRITAAALFAIGISLGIVSFYLLPLTREFSYLNQGTHETIFTPNSAIDIGNLFREGLGESNYLHIGIFELFIIVMGALLVLKSYLKKKRVHILLGVSLISLLIYVLLISKVATPLFYLIKPLGNIQHQWRFLSATIFIAPFIFAVILKSLPSRAKLVTVAIAALVIFTVRMPQAKGKEYIKTPESQYFSSTKNLYAEVMNTLWSGSTESYPKKETKGEVIEGRGIIVDRQEHNSWRRYEVVSVDTIRMIDNTFYFPGWKVYVDGLSVPVEFQDIDYRGIIIYTVPAGKHTVLVRFEDTKTRFYANVLSLVSAVTFGLLYYLRPRYQNALK
jgi:uncharacterized membrane protein